MVGDILAAYPLAADNDMPGGVAYDDATGDVFVLDLGDAGSLTPARIFLYRHTFSDPGDVVGPRPAPGASARAIKRVVASGEDTVTLTRQMSPLPIPHGADDGAVCRLRGLAFAAEGGQGALYTLAYRPGSRGFSALWRIDVATWTAEQIDLRDPVQDRTCGIDGCQVFDVSVEAGTAYVAYDAAALNGHRRQARRGILKLNVASFDHPVLDRHIPSTGMGVDDGDPPAACRGLTIGRVDDRRYLFGTASHTHLYAATWRTGRGLFCFDMPELEGTFKDVYGLGFGAGCLWVIESHGTQQHLLRVDVAGDPYEPLTKDRRVRHVEMRITTTPEGDAPDSSLGDMHHNYCLPPDKPSQGADRDWDPVDASPPDPEEKRMTFRPSGDETFEQEVVQFKYANAGRHDHYTAIEFDAWTSYWRRFVYPHRVPTGTWPPGVAEGGYTEDAPAIFGLKDAEIWDAFIDRVKDYIARVHKMERRAVTRQMRNPYWAARNLIEYIYSAYYYPNSAEEIDPYVDLDANHYDAIPASLKAELSAAGYDDPAYGDHPPQVLHCEGGNFLFEAALRYLGVPARTIGSTHQTSYGVTETGEASEASWDQDGDGFLGPGEVASAVNGHRWTEVWLGPDYRWILFDGTPAVKIQPGDQRPPKAISQWDLMDECAGPVTAKRLITTVYSGRFPPTFLPAVPGKSAGQGYNLKGKPSERSLWQHGQHRIHMSAGCFLRRIRLRQKLTGSAPGSGLPWEVVWVPTGRWDLDPDATLTLTLEKDVSDGEGFQKIEQIGKEVPHDAGSLTFSLGDAGGSGVYRVKLTKDGDSETGGYSNAVRILRG